MKCQICKSGETRDGVTTVTLERDGVTLVVRGVPAQVCENCGEEYVDAATAARVLDSAETAVADGVKVDVRDYVAA